jgi:ferredoxin|nr:class I ribonucleotide reductase maintenance protein YfaE [Pseudoalteromonas sp. BSi20480]|tara:strand:- start:34 stop:282 length:249 start_codon:yes stop_codon:yes gene_type:complete
MQLKIDGKLIGTCHPDKTILENMEALELAPYYMCRDGFCGACRIKIKSGTVIYPSEPLCFVRDGEVLTCCSKAETDIDLETD